MKPIQTPDDPQSDNGNQVPDTTTPAPEKKSNLPIIAILAIVVAFFAAKALNIF